MKIGVPKEIKNHEYRVGLVPASVRELTTRGHEVFVQSMAGDGIGVLDEEYEAARRGDTLHDDREQVVEEQRKILEISECGVRLVENL